MALSFLNNQTNNQTKKGLWKQENLTHHYSQNKNFHYIIFRLENCDYTKY